MNGTSKMDYEALGRRIRFERQQVALTQEQLANNCGISASFLGHIERGSRKASLETLVSIANALKVGADVLLKDSLILETGNHEVTMRQISKLVDQYAHEYHYMVASLDSSIPSQCSARQADGMEQE